LPAQFLLEAQPDPGFGAERIYLGGAGERVPRIVPPLLL